MTINPDEIESGGSGDDLDKINMQTDVTLAGNAADALIRTTTP